MAELRRQIGHILGLDQHDKIILIGAGNLGRAITVHIGFQKYGYELAGIFDSNISLENIEISGIKIMHTNRLAEFCKENHPKMAVLCIPKSGGGGGERPPDRQPDDAVLRGAQAGRVFRRTIIGRGEHGRIKSAVPYQRGGFAFGGTA